MCIALFSTAHPRYALILLSNRDEYLTRPTLPAGFWSPPESHVLGGRDLLRPVHGTWLGITRTGLIAALTNYREEGQLKPSLRSRGAMANAFLSQAPGDFASTADFVKHLTEEGEGLTDVGGFSLVCGKIGQPLAVVSNRTPNIDGTEWLMRGRGETVGLSNTVYGNHTWEKVRDGEEFLRRAIENDLRQPKSDEPDLINHLFAILSDDKMPLHDTATWDTQVGELRKSIFIPKIETHEAGGAYGTQKQTVILVSREGHVIFTERTLYDEGARPIERTKGDRRFKFDIEGWDSTSPV